MPICENQTLQSVSVNQGMDTKVFFVCFFFRLQSVMLIIFQLSYANTDDDDDDGL